MSPVPASLPPAASSTPPRPIIPPASPDLPSLTGRTVPAHRRHRQPMLPARSAMAVPNLSVLHEPALPHFDIHAPDMQEDSLLDADLPAEIEQTQPDAPVTYDIVVGATKRGNSHLVDSLSYTYFQTKTTKAGPYWRCTVQNKPVCCN